MYRISLIKSHKALVLAVLALLLAEMITSCAPTMSTPAVQPAVPAVATVAPTVPAAPTAAASSPTPAGPIPVGKTGSPALPKSSTVATPKVKDAAYATLSPAQKLDLYVPQGAGPFPLIVVVHGGGFMLGDKSGVPGIDYLLSTGYAVASLNYRLSGEAKAPAQIQDVKTAVRWLRANAAQYNLNSDRFGAWGASAGGSLVALLGTSCGARALEGAELGHADQSSCVQAVVDWFGPIDFLTMDQQFSGTGCPQNHNEANSPESQVIGAPIQDKPELVKTINAITYITPKAPPFYIQHGTADCNVPPQQSQQLYDALKPAIGADKVTLNFLPGAGHGTSQFDEASNMKLVTDFFDRHLK